MKELAKDFYLWATKTFSIATLCMALAKGDNRKNPQIPLYSVAKELFNMGFFGNGNVNEHFLKPGSQVNTLCSQGYFYQLIENLSFEEGREEYWKILKQKKTRTLF